MPTGLDRFDEEAKEQARFFASRGVGVYATLLETLTSLLADGEALVCGAFETAWRERSFHAAYERPLLVLAALRQDALASPHHPLARAIGADSTGNATVSADDVVASFATHAGARAALAHRFVQTNEVSRAVAWRLALRRLTRAKRVHLVDLGCSAGLNLVADRIDLTWTDRDGAPIALPPAEAVVARIGLDRSPIDPRDESERAWLRACLWPGQRARRARIDAALDAASGAIARGEMQLLVRSALAMPAFLDELSATHPQDSVVAYQTVFSAYLEPDERTAYLEAMGAWARAGGGRGGTRLWVELEAAPSDAGDGPAELRAHGHHGTLVLGHCEYHPSVLRLDPRAVRELERL